MKKEQLIRYYSGPRSVKFWDLINKQIKRCKRNHDVKTSADCAERWQVGHPGKMLLRCPASRVLCKRENEQHIQSADNGD